MSFPQRGGHSRTREPVSPIPNVPLRRVKTRALPQEKKEGSLSPVQKGGDEEKRSVTAVKGRGKRGRTCLHVQTGSFGPVIRRLTVSRRLEKGMARSEHR